MMLFGSVTVGLEGVTTVQLRGLNGVVVTPPAIIDTGCVGTLTISPETVVALGLVPYKPSTPVFASGTVLHYEMYRVEPF